MDSGTFFREATLRLCGTLDMPEAFGSFFEYLQFVMPATSLGIGRVDFDAGEGEALVMCDQNGVDISQKKAYLTPAQLEEMDEALRVRGEAREGIFALTLEDPTARFLCSVSPRGTKPPLFFMRIRSGRDFWVGCTVACSAENPLTPEHLALLRSLRAPLLATISNCMRYNELETLKEAMVRDNLELRTQLGQTPASDVTGRSASLAAVMKEARLAAVTDVPVLITGETGTGKEVMARAVHGFSKRASAPFVAVNCGALPPTLIDSELFGHARGAFTGASQEHRGYFEQAHGGTIFLDEIGELPLEAQARLLRVLQEKRIERVGGTAPLAVDFRLIAATNRDLKRMTAEGRFREDLFYRLHVVQLRVPPLRDRRDDIPLLAARFLQEAARRFGIPAPQFAPGEMRRLMERDWPGNVRELRNTVEATLALNPMGPLHFAPDDEDGNGAEQKKGHEEGPSLAGTLPEAWPSFVEWQRRYFRDLLDACKGRVAGPGGAAARAGMKPNTMRFRLDKLGIPYGRKKS